MKFPLTSGGRKQVKTRHPEMARLGPRSPQHRRAIGRGIRLAIKEGRYNFSRNRADSACRNLEKARKGGPWNKGIKLRGKQNLWNRSSYRRKMKNLRKKEWRDPEIRRRQHVARKKSWENPSERRLESHRKKLKSICGKRISSIQRKLWYKLRRFEFRIEYPFSRYFLDIANPKTKICVEVDGYFFHKDKEERDSQRDRFLKKNGWIVIRIGSAELSRQGEIRNFIKAMQERGELPLR